MNQSNLARVDFAQYRMSDVALATILCVCRVCPAFPCEQNAGKGGRHQTEQRHGKSTGDKVWTIGSRRPTPNPRVVKHELTDEKPREPSVRLRAKATGLFFVGMSSQRSKALLQVPKLLHIFNLSCLSEKGD